MELNANTNLVRVTVLSLCVCVSVTLLTAMPLTYEHNVKLKANVLLMVFDLWISLKILRSKCLKMFFAHHNKFEF